MTFVPFFRNLYGFAYAWMVVVHCRVVVVVVVVAVADYTPTNDTDVCGEQEVVVVVGTSRYIHCNKICVDERWMITNRRRPTDGVS
jgi:hypothetical protein